MCPYVYAHLYKFCALLSDQSFLGHRQQTMCAYVCWGAQLRVVFNIHLFIFIPALAGQAAACYGKCYAELELVVPGTLVGGSMRMGLAAENRLFPLAQEA